MDIDTAEVARKRLGEGEEALDKLLQRPDIGAEVLETMFIMPKRCITTFEPVKHLKPEYKDRSSFQALCEFNPKLLKELRDALALSPPTFWHIGEFGV